MNYYEHHIGDYAQATAHLSMLEDAAYGRLLRWYYAEEKPIPSDLRQACRIARAATEDEREAVRVVLEEFFTLGEDGWHQKRADAEIERYRAKSEKARVSAKTRWGALPSHSDRDATNTVAALPTQSERNANASPEHANASEMDAKAMLTSNQTPVKEKALPPQASATATPRKPEPRATRIPDDWSLTPELSDIGRLTRREAGLPEIDLRLEAAKFVDFWRAKSGKDATKLDWTATWRNWCRNATAKAAPYRPASPDPIFKTAQELGL